MTVSGDVTNASVFALPSLRFGKLRLYELTIVFARVRVHVRALPLPDARAAHVREDSRADGLEVGEQPVALDRRPHLLGTGCDEQLCLGRQALGRGLPRDRRGPSDVFVRRVRAGADEGRRDLQRPVVRLRGCTDLAHLVGQVGGVWAVDERLERREVDLDDAIEEPGGVGLDFGIRAQIARNRVRRVRDRLSPGRLQVGGHVRVVREQRSGSADLGAHVADRALPGRGDRVGARAEVLDDRAGTALDGEHLGDLQDDVFRR